MYEPEDGAPAHHPPPPTGAEPTGSADADDSTEGGPMPAGDAITPDLVKVALRRVKDPEINLNIIDLGLVYDIVVDGRDVRVDMSLTSPGCPSGPEIMGDAERAVQSVEGVGTATINLVWSPPWTPDRIEPRVRAYLGF
jgi:metal-sulfur cluster biosynthetic enzyme